MHKSFVHATEWSSPHTYGMCKYPNHSSTPRNGAPRTHMGCANSQIIRPRHGMELSAHIWDVQIPKSFVHAAESSFPRTNAMCECPYHSSTQKSFVHATESSSPHANGVCECPNHSSTPLNGASRTQMRCTNHSSTPRNGARRTRMRCANLHYSGGWSDLKAPRKCTNVQFVAE
jgi:hypothetical protein